MKSFRRLKSRLRRYRVLLICIAIAATLIGYGFSSQPDPPPQVDISQAYSLIQQGKVQRAEMKDASSEVVLTTAEGQVRSTYVTEGGSNLQQRLIDSGVPTTVVPIPVATPLQIFVNMLPLLLLCVLVLIVYRGGLLARSFSVFRGGRGEAEGSVPKARFSDVAGADEAVAQCRELVDAISHPRSYERLGAKVPSGALFIGPPGTGKTLLARAVAGEAGLPFFSMTGSDFVEVFAGTGAARVRSLFDKARAKGTAILFIDEIDAVGRKRSSNGEDSPSAGMNSEEDRTLTALLTEMDGFSGRKHSGDGLVIVIAATNRPEVLDGALTRPGRLDRRVEVPLPDPRGRAQILAVHARTRTMAQDVDLQALASQTPGMSGAELEQVVNEAALVAVRRKGREVAQGDLVEAINIVTLGRARTSALLTPADRAVTAWHEAGHAAVGLLDPASPDPIYATLIPRGAAGGFTRTAGRDEQFITRAQALARLRVLLAGRAAEEMHFGPDEVTHGAADDIQAATSLATEMVTRFGMSRLGLAHVEQDSLRLGAQVAAEVRGVVEEMLATALEEAQTLLLSAQGTALCAAIADHLALNEEVHAEELAALKDSLATGLPQAPVDVAEVA